MKLWRWTAVVALATCMALAPALAEARAGGGTSQGSRGSRTYESNSGQTMQRSTTPQAAPSRPQMAPSPASPMSPGFQPSFMQRHPFISGLAGGFLGAGLFGMMFGHSAFAADGSPMGSGLGLLLQIALIGGLAYFAYRLWRGRSQVAGAMAGGGMARSVGAMAAPAVHPEPVQIPVSEADYNAWGQLLVGIQDAWSKADLMAMRRFVTPEMLGYFSEQLAANASRGVENRIEDVTLTKGDVEEAWDENGFDYVTARLRWTARDYTVRAGSNQLVEGDQQRPAEATEFWTFVRAHGGQWLLSAIQQV